MVDAPSKTPGTTSSSVVRVDVVEGEVTAIDTILATDKLARVDEP